MRRSEFYKAYAKEWVYIVYAKDPSNLIIYLIIFKVARQRERIVLWITLSQLDRQSESAILWIINTRGKPLTAENLGFSRLGMVSRGFLLEMC